MPTRLCIKRNSKVAAHSTSTKPLEPTRPISFHNEQVLPTLQVRMGELSGSFPTSPPIFYALIPQLLDSSISMTITCRCRLMAGLLQSRFHADWGQVYLRYRAPPDRE